MPAAYSCASPAIGRGIPLGALSVIAMLAVLAAQVTTGLISDPDDFINVGPLAKHVASSTRSAAVGWHGLGGNLILLLVVLHVGMILFYRFWKHEDLVGPMLTGEKEVPEEIAHKLSHDRPTHQI